MNRQRCLAGRWTGGADVAHLQQTVPEMIVMSDTCFCEYTSQVTAVCCASMASTTTRLWKIWQASRGCSCCRRRLHRPFRRMDGQVQAIRHALDAAGFKDTRLCRIRPSSPPPFMARSVKRRKRIKRRPQKLSDEPNEPSEAIRESLLDEAQGADCLMVNQLERTSTSCVSCVNVLNCRWRVSGER